MVRKVINSGTGDPGDSTHYGTDDLGKVNLYLTGTDQSSTDPASIATSTTYVNQRLLLRNPANTFSLTFNNPVVTSNYNFQFNTPYDYYVFVDPDNSNLYTCRDNRTGAIVSTNTHADVALQAAIDALSVGSVYNAVGTDNQNYWTGGKYGGIFVGPGIFDIYSAVILKSNITMQCCGSWVTRFRWRGGVNTNDNTADMFQSSQWVLGTGGHPNMSYQANLYTSQQRQQGDRFFALRGCTIDGNRVNRTGLTNNIPVSGQNSWGHGIAYYGCPLLLDDVNVINCPGAGIIIQTPAFNLGNSNFSDSMNNNNTYCDFKNLWVANNGAQGILVRTNVSINGYHSYFNGEPGIDIQVCDYFGGSVFPLANANIFWDSQNHGGLNSNTYDANGPEIRVTGGGINYLGPNCWIEAPYCLGDNLQLGIPGNPTQSGYTLGGYCTSVKMIDARFDDMRSYAILANEGAQNIWGSCTIQAKQGNYLVAPATWSSQNGVKILKGLIDLDMDFEDLNPYGDVLTMGDANNPISDCIIRIRGDNNSRYILWGNASNNRNIITIRDTSIQNTSVVFDTTNPLPSFTDGKNHIEVKGFLTGASTDNNVNKGSRSGTINFSGNGSATTFAIPHHLFTAPTYVNVQPGSSDALGPFYLTADGTNVTVNYGIAPHSGTNNLTFWWEAKVGTAS